MKGYNRKPRTYYLLEILTKDYDLRGDYHARSAQCVRCAHIGPLGHQECNGNRRKPRLLQQKLCNNNVSDYISDYISELITILKRANASVKSSIMSVFIKIEAVIKAALTRGGFESLLHCSFASNKNRFKDLSTMIRRILLICALGIFCTRALLVNYTISFVSVKLLFTRNSLTKDYDIRGIYPDRSAQCVPCTRIELLWHQKCHRNRRKPRLLQQKLQQQRLRHIA